MEGGAGYTSRGGLSSRPRQDHLQIHIDPGAKFDYDSQLAALRGDVAKVKQMAYAINDEQKLQGQEINQLEEYMDKAKMLLSQASRKLTLVSKQSRSWLTLYVLLFCVGLFICVFVLNKLRTVGRLFFWR